jgi:hypothetical protein
MPIPNLVQVYDVADHRGVFREKGDGWVLSLRFLDGGRLAVLVNTGAGEPDRRPLLSGRPLIMKTGLKTWTWAPETLLAEVKRRVKRTLTDAEFNDLMRSKE